MVSGSLVLAYHGCDKSLAEKIITGQEQLWHSERPWDWLGHGIYFWEDSPTRALHWAQEESRKTNGKVTTPAVIYCRGPDCFAAAALAILLLAGKQGVARWRKAFQI